MPVPFVQPPLPYSQDALAPVISANTLSFHYGKHHKAYVDKLNELATGTKYAEMSLIQVIRESAKDEAGKAVFNNAAQAWNHEFYWQCLSKDHATPSKKMQELIDKSFGNLETFQKQFAAAGVAQFGSGWAWLVATNDGRLEIVKTPNAETPITTSARPLLTVDVWEHAYYLDYQNKRADHTAAVVSKLLNWEFAEKNLASKL